MLLEQKYKQIKVNLAHSNPFPLKQPNRLTKVPLTHTGMDTQRSCLGRGNANVTSEPHTDSVSHTEAIFHGLQMFSPFTLYIIEASMFCAQLHIYVLPSHNPHNNPQVSAHIDFMDWADRVTGCPETYTSFIMDVSVRIPLGKIKV